MTTPRDHPLWPKFKALANQKVPGQMHGVYWDFFLAGVEADVDYDGPRDYLGRPAKDASRMMLILSDRPSDGDHTGGGPVG